MSTGRFAFARNFLKRVGRQGADADVPPTEGRMLGTVATIDTFSLPPDGAGSVTAFSRMGYDLESALADIIDNSIDATAEHVEITFFRNDNSIVAVTIADNGDGMSEDELRASMRFAGATNRAASALGAFGLGMKAASLSQCQVLTVISRQARRTAACRWSFAEIGGDWRCASLDPVGSAELFHKGFSVVEAPTDKGTVVVWERLNRLGVTGDLDEFLWSLLARLEMVLGLIFHRFIAQGQVSISIGVRELDEAVAFPRKVRSHDPFGYPQSGRPSYPKRFVADLPQLGQLNLDCHIWPAGANQPEFRLGRRTGTSSQGFYFYRNDRLIQTGGWNGVVKDTSDPELSLARVAVDLPASAGRDVSVQKSSLQVTASLALALDAARSEGATLQDYLEDARRTYRAGQRQPRSAGNVPIVPGGGFPTAARRTIAQKMAKDELFREVAFEWAPLGRQQIFAVDPDSECIFLNSKYRQQIIGPVRASGVDAPIIKLLLFLLFQHEFSRQRQSAKRREWHAHCNALLYETVKTL